MRPAGPTKTSLFFVALSTITSAEHPYPDTSLN